MNGRKIMKYGRPVGYTYHCLIFLFWFADNYSVGHINWVIVVLLGADIAALLLQQSWADRFWGFLTMLGSLYMLLAVLSNLAKHSGLVQSNGFGVQIGIGAGVFLLSLASAVIIFIAGLPVFDTADGLSLKDD